MKDEEFFDILRGTQFRFSRVYSRLLLEQDLTLAQFALLNLLVHSGPISMTQASRELDVTKPAITHLVDHLERAGMICREACDGDRRSYMLCVRTKGKKAVEKIQQVIFSKLEKTLEELPSASRKVVKRFYTSLSKKMELLLEDLKEKP